MSVLRRDDAGPEKTIEPREFTIEIRIAAVEQRLLATGPDAAARGLTVLRVERVRAVHAAHHFPERREPLRVEAGVVAEADEHLCGAAVRHGERERDHSTAIRSRGAIVGD